VKLLYYIKHFLNILAKNEIFASFFLLGILFPIVVLAVMVGSYLIGAIGLFVIGYEIKQIYDFSN
jgi:hypothetical protein